VSENDSHEPVTVTDKRRIDPQTGEVRETASGRPQWAGAGRRPRRRDQAAELTADLQRVQADFANYRKRAARPAGGRRPGQGRRGGPAAPVLDDLDRARADLESGPLKSVADKLTAALPRLGLTAFGAEGDEFDPSLHEAVQHEGDGSKPVIGTVMRQGTSSATRCCGTRSWAWSTPSTMRRPSPVPPDRAGPTIRMRERNRHEHR
jgi:molecular chaperone GrpE